MENPIPCFYCGAMIEISPESVRELQTFSRKYASADCCVNCRRKFIDAYLVEYDKKKAKLARQMEQFAVEYLIGMKTV